MPAVRRLTRTLEGEGRVKDSDTTIGNLIDKAGVSIISSVDEHGFPNTKAMLSPRRASERASSASTSRPTRPPWRVSQYLSNPKASVYFFDGRFFRGVMLRGTMEVLQDSESKESIWRDGDDTYYPGGVNRPDYCVLRFTAQDGRYYHSYRSEDFEIA